MRGAALALLFATAGAALPARAQEATLQELRMRQLEASVRALQAQVFAAGKGGAPAAAGPVATPASGPLTDMLTRMDALEAQIARLTAQNEEQANRLRQLEGKLAAPAATAVTVAPAATAPASGAPAQLVPEKAPEKSATATNLAAMTGGASEAKHAAKPAEAKPAGPEKPSAARVAAVKAVIKPKTADAGDDEYSYGFRLWEGKFYPEAQQQLKLFLDKYPKHAKASHGRNLLGRAYLDDGKPRDAAAWFLKNYQTDAQGPRAADSLLGLAQAMGQLQDNNRACIALSEFATNYPAEAKGRLKAPYDSTRAGITCSQ
ncbi:MAG: hypothetical protein JSS36_12465 [Proteobacteria bacterium]|nr:hypothetical protein [Pseudomonadota bacterium]